jgi:large subunit ribosomal protein L4
MAELDIRDPSGNAVGKVVVPDEIALGEIHEAVLHQTVVAHLANRRQGTSSTKTRSDVSGSGRKLFRQKGLGRARAGDLRSPTRVHGGVAHGPKPRDYRQRTPKKMRRLALVSALRAKFQTGSIYVVERFGVESGAPRTKTIAQLLNTLGLEGRKTLLVLPEHNPIVYLSARNIPGVSISTSALLHAYDVMLHQAIVILPTALSALNARLGVAADEGEGS